MFEGREELKKMALGSEHFAVQEGIDIGSEVVSATAFQKGHLGYKGRGWFLLVETATETAFAPVKDVQKNIFFLGIIILIVSMFIALLISRSISKPVKKLREAAEKIAHGDLDEPIEIKSKDEIGELGESFDNMRYSMRMVINEYEGMKGDLETEEKLKREIELRKESEKKLKFLKGKKKIREIIGRGSKEGLTTKEKIPNNKAIKKAELNNIKNKLVKPKDKNEKGGKEK